MFKRWMTLRHLVALMIVALVASLPAPTQASAGLPSTLFDPNSIGWASVRTLTSSDFHDDFEARKADGYMVIDLEILEMGGAQRVSAVWQKNTDGRGWASLRGLTDAAFHQKWTEFRAQGYRLIDQEAYILDGDRYYAGVWVQNRENLDWGSYRNADTNEFHTKYLEYKNAGYIPVDVDAYDMAGGTRYSAIWVRNVENLDWVLLRNMSSAEYGARFDEYKSRYRVHDIESYVRDGDRNYAAIWIENKNHRDWKAIRDMSAQSYADTWTRLNDEGYRLTDFEVYPVGLSYRYAGVWRQNSNRPSWSLKDDVDSYLQSQKNQFNIPGISVVIAQNGEIKYMRGFGYADINDDKVASSKTVYRLASVSKAVAGVLTMRLVEKGEVTLVQQARTHAPFIPAAHNYTIRQLLSNRSGSGHYDEWGSSNSNFTTAAAAALLFINKPLVCAPGTCYLYSTHGYTMLGAALEGATGKTVTNLVRDEITNPYALPTLRKENRSVADPNRASVYASNTTINIEVPADNTSWKVLGGGLESSAYDLTRFGMKLLNGSILTAGSRTTMWTKPDNLSNYALGWDTGTDQGFQVVAKGGDQLGSDSYIRIYPTKNIVISVLTNRNRPHDAGTIGRQIGTLMLDAASKGKAEADTATMEKVEEIKVAEEVVGLVTE